VSGPAFYCATVEILAARLTARGQNHGKISSTGTRSTERQGAGTLPSNDNFSKERNTAFTVELFFVMAERRSH
jgi:hypothetical protein